jgi:hypothetical protein
LKTRMIVRFANLLRPTLAERISRRNLRVPLWLFKVQLAGPVPDRLLHGVIRTQSDSRR